MACIEILFNPYSHLVFAVAMKYLHHSDESKDAVIEIFEKVPSDIKRYDIKNFSQRIYKVRRRLFSQLDLITVFAVIFLILLIIVVAVVHFRKK